MMDNCSTEDSVTLGDKLARAKTSFESLRRALLGRKRILDDGHVQVCLSLVWSLLDGLSIILPFLVLLFLIVSHS